MIAGFYISSKTEDMDLHVIHDFISNSYWAKDIPFETMQRAVQNSLCFAVFSESGQQVAFARMITDSATYAYLADVFVLPEYRGKGISKWLIQSLMQAPQVQGLRRITLATKDAHGLYDSFGFKSLTDPDRFMELWNPDVYASQD